MFLYNDPRHKPLRRELRQNQTDAEELLWSYLRNNQFEGVKFFRQYGVGRYILDFYCAEFRLAIELDGSQHMEELGQEYDKQRTAYLNGLGVKVLRFWNNEVLTNIAGVLEQIKTRITLD